MFISKCIYIFDKLKEGRVDIDSLVELPKSHGILTIAVENSDDLSDEDLLSLL